MAEKRRWPLACEDESILTYDSTMRSIWAKKGSRPRILVTGSHKRICLFGALTQNHGHLFRQYAKMNGYSFTAFLRQLKQRYGCLILLIDRAPWHRSRIVKTFLDANRSRLHVLYFPANAPELNPVEECWRQMKNDVVGSTFHPTFQQLKSTLTTYMRRKRYKQNLFRYLRQ
jgi:transposase